MSQGIVFIIREKQGRRPDRADAQADQRQFFFAHFVFILVEDPEN